MAAKLSDVSCRRAARCGVVRALIPRARRSSREDSQAFRRQVARRILLGDSRRPFRPALVAHVGEGVSGPKHTMGCGDVGNGYCRRRLDSRLPACQSEARRRAYRRGRCLTCRADLASGWGRAPASGASTNAPCLSPNPTSIAAHCGFVPRSRYGRRAGQCGRRE